MQLSLTEEWWCSTALNCQCFNLLVLYYTKYKEKFQTEILLWTQ